MINAVALRLQLMRHMAVTAAPITVYSRGYDKSTYRILQAVCRAFGPATDCFVIGNIKPGSGHSRGERIQESRAAWRYEREYYFHAHSVSPETHRHHFDRDLRDSVATSGLSGNAEN